MSAGKDVGLGGPGGGRSLPEGTVTFVFTDIEGSTKLLHELGDDIIHVLNQHDRVIRAVMAHHHGIEVDKEGDSLFVVFSQPADAVTAALDAQLALAKAPWPHGRPLRVRMGIHTGAATVVDNGYVGLPVHEAARISAAAHGGQVLLSEVTARLVSEGLPSDVALVDLGRHSLKDFPEPRRLYQLSHVELASVHPPLRSLSATGHNLAAPTTSFVGREAEVAGLQRLLTGDARLVTITGPGGIGKSRAALEVGWSLLSRFREGVWFVGLASVSDTAGVVPTIASSLGVAEEPGVGLLQVIEHRLATGPVLVVLDNFEQVMDGATIVADLLAACPPLRVVVTSRERLRLRGEYEFVLEPLTVPDPDTVDPVEVVATPAGALFAQRAAAATLGFKADGGNAAAVASICRDTDGLPLAIELAAARVRDFPIDELASRLTTALDVLVEGQRDLPTRQQTLRTAIGWSYDLLNPIEQRMFKALATFAGGASASALRAVTGGRTDVVATMAALGAKSLVLEVPTADDEGRWWALETIHQFGLELLARDPEKGALAQAHAARFVELARRAAAELTGADQAQWLARLDTDLENLRLALERGSTAQRLSLTAALARFWLNRGYWSEGRRWLERALESPGGNDGERLMVLLGACHLAQRQGDLHRATTHAQDGLALAARIDDVVMRAQFLNQLGEIARHQGDADRGLSMLADALTVARAGGDERVIGLVLNNIGVIQLTLLQDFAGARATYAEALAIHRATSAHRDTATTLNNLAICALATGDFADGANLALEGREVAEAIGDAALGAQFDLTLAEAAQALGRLDEARSRLESSLAAYERLGDTTGEAATAMALAHVCAETGDTTTGAQLARRARAGWAAKDRADLVLACDELLTGLSSGSPPRSPR